MAWRVVVQPDKKYAVFSDVVDNFTLFNMSRAEAVDYCFVEISDGERHYREQCRRLNVIRPFTSEEYWKLTAEEKVKRAEDAPERWEEELGTIKNIHGEDGVREALGWVKRGYSHWPLLQEDREKKRQFKNGDKAKTLHGEEVLIEELLPNEWYRVKHPKGFELWKDWELQPMEVRV